MKLKIALVATQCESPEASGDLSSSCERLLEVTRNHLASLSADLFFVNEVMMTSSKSPTRDFLEDLHNKVAAVCCDPQLKVTADELRPMSWHKFLATVSRSAHMSLENARDFWAKEKQEVGETENIKPNEVETLKSLQNFTRAMIEEKNSHILPTGQWYSPSAVNKHAWYCMVLHGIAWYCIVLHGVAWYCMVLQGIAWYCMVMHGIA